MVAEHGMLRGTLAADAAALEDTMATAAATVATVAVAGDALTLGAAACRRRLQRVRGDDDDAPVETAVGPTDEPTTRQLDFTGTAAGSREVPVSPGGMSTVEEFVDEQESLVGPATEAPHETEEAMPPDARTTSVVLVDGQAEPAAVPASTQVMPLSTMKIDMTPVRLRSTEAAPSTLEELVLRWRSLPERDFNAATACNNLADVLI